MTTHVTLLQDLFLSRKRGTVVTAADAWFRDVKTRDSTCVNEMRPARALRCNGALGRQATWRRRLPPQAKVPAMNWRKARPPKTLSSHKLLNGNDLCVCARETDGISGAVR